VNTEVLDRIVFGAFANAVVSPDRPDIVDWCEANRTLRGAHGGPWRRDYCKWSLEIMRACVDASTRVVVVRGASQVAKTECLLLNVWAGLIRQYSIRRPR
jgi:phage terminase large subunit GpA-like protein